MVKGRTYILFPLGLLLLAGCSGTRQSEASVDTQRWPRCQALDAEIAGIDKQIGLHYEEIYDVKWRVQAFGAVSKVALEASERHKDEIIQLRGKRQELYSRGKADNCFALTDDSWNAHVYVEDKIRAVRDPSQPEGYALIGVPTVKEYLKLREDFEKERGETSNR